MPTKEQAGTPALQSLASPLNPTAEMAASAPDPGPDYFCIERSSQCPAGLNDAAWWARWEAVYPNPPSGQGTPDVSRIKILAGLDDLTVADFVHKGVPVVKDGAIIKAGKTHHLLKGTGVIGQYRTVAQRQWRSEMLDQRRINFLQGQMVPPERRIARDEVSVALAEEAVDITLAARCKRFAKAQNQCFITCAPGFNFDGRI